MEEAIELVINKLINLLRETPRNEINDPGLTQAEEVLTEYRDSLKNPVATETYHFSPFSGLKEGDYVEGVEAYGLSYQIMRGWVSKIHSTHIDIRCDDWYEGQRANVIYPYDTYGIKKLNERTPDWWKGRTLTIRHIGDKAHED